MTIGNTADIVDIDGVERIVGYSALRDDSGGLLVSFGLDKAQAFTEIQRGTQRGIFLIVLSTSLVSGPDIVGRPAVHPSSAWRNWSTPPTNGGSANFPDV